MKDYAEMLQVLADKFGTTVEYLWGVMIVQAPLSSTINLFVIIGWIVFILWAFKFVQVKTKKPEGDGYQQAEWEGEVAFLAWAVLLVVGIITLIVAGCKLEGIMTGYFNPEYWALMKLKG